MNLDKIDTEVIKVCLVGNSCVGKSSISIRFVRDVFYPNIHPTLGVAYLSRTMCSEMGKEYKFQIWDTAGQERYRSLVPIYYQSASVVLIVFDVTNRDSLFVGAARWMDELQNVGPEDAMYALVGNKAEVNDNERQVSEHEGRKWAAEMGIIYREVSAKSGKNITELFKNLCTLLDGRLVPKPPSDSSTNRHNATKFGVFLKPHSAIRNRVETLKLQYRVDNSSDTNCCGRFCKTT